MTQASDIGWSSYESFEGPFFLGRIPYAGPSVPDFGDKCIAVVTATEGGHFDAINMYDSCILTVGIIQVCERVHECSNMLGSCAARNKPVLLDYLSKLPVPMTIVQAPQWRLAFADTSSPAFTIADMQRAYLGGGTGQKGSWNDTQKTFAKEVAAGFSTMWEHPDMRAGQMDYIKPRLIGFALPRARKELFSDPSNDEWSGAIKAAYISYAANIPVVADRCLATAMADPTWATANTQGKFLLMASAMVHSGIGIWPNRYRAIQPVLNKMFGVTVPSLETLIGIPITHPAAPPTTDKQFGTVMSVQLFLLAHGYDLGPYKADGVLGNCTRQAIMKFQSDQKLPQTGTVDEATRARMIQIAAPDTRS